MDTQVETFKARLAEIAQRLTQIQDGADRLGRDLTKSEASEIDTLAEEFESIERQLATRERITGITGATGRRTEPNPINAGGMPGRRFDPAHQHALTGNRYSDLFGPVNATTQRQNPWRSFAELAFVAASNPLDQRLLIRDSSMTESSGESGGFGVPLQFVAELLDASYELEALRPLCSVIPMTSNMATVPSFDVFDQTSGKRAGLQLAWAAEGGTWTDQSAKLVPMTLKAGKGGIFVRVSSELTEDFPAFERRLQAKMVDAIAAGLDLAFVNGNGAGVPLGILSSPCLKIVPK